MGISVCVFKREVEKKDKEHKGQWWGFNRGVGGDKCCRFFDINGTCSQINWPRKNADIFWWI